MSKQPKITEKDYHFIKELLLKGTPYTEIGEIYGINYRTVSYYIRKLDLHRFSNQYIKEMSAVGNLFEQIDTPEKAYVLGFILGDGGFSSNNQKDCILISVALRDREVVDFVADCISGNVHIDTETNIDRRKFPKASVVKTIPHIIKHLGGRLKKDRHYPRIKQDLERFLLLGLFDADGSIACGYRKDRGRFWCTISFTHHLKCLTGLQKFLYKIGISTIVAPKHGEDAYVIRFSGKEDIIKFLDYLYPEDNTFIVLKRKYEKAKAVRLELGEIGGSQKVIPSRAIG